MTFSDRRKPGGSPSQRAQKIMVGPPATASVAATPVSQTREDQPGYWPPAIRTVIREVMGEQRATERPRIARKRPGKQTAEETLCRRLLEIVVYDKCCRIGGTLTMDDLAETEVGDWKMPDFKAACAYAASQGWLIVEDDVLTLTTAGLAAA